jgi:soluble lytic murein transglycosylase-like protein
MYADLMTPQTKLALVAPIAARFGLKPEIVAAVCEQESAWNPWAVRFEVGFLHSYIKPQSMMAPTTDELMRSCSFGLMQIMGQVAIEFGFGGKFLTELCDPATGVLYGCRKLQKCYSVHGDDETSLLAYNGGGNLGYAHQVLARVSHYAGF